MPFTIASAAMTAVSVTTAAAETNNPVITWVTILINAAMLIVNAGIEIYRKIRDRDEDKKKQKDDNGDDSKKGE